MVTSGKWGNVWGEREEKLRFYMSCLSQHDSTCNYDGKSFLCIVNEIHRYISMKTLHSKIDRRNASAHFSFHHQIFYFNIEKMKGIMIIVFSGGRT